MTISKNNSLAWRRLQFKSRATSPMNVPIDGRWFWLFPLIIIISMPFLKQADLKIALSAMAAATSCCIVLAAVRYQLSSLVAIVALTHLIFYSLPAWGNLFLAEPAVRPDLWEHTDYAMWGCVVGMTAFAAGSWLLETHTEMKGKSNQVSFLPPSFRIFNIRLVTLLILVAIIKVILGLFFHSSLDYGYTYENIWYNNTLSLITHIAYCGIYLQTYRYIYTRSWKDAQWALGLALFAILIFLPTGSRSSAFGFLPSVLVVFLSWETDSRKKLAICLSGIVLILIYSVSINRYRTDPRNASLAISERYASAIKSPLTKAENPTREKSGVEIFLGRLSDYIATGRIIAYSPEIIPYRGEEGMEYWWHTFVPGFLKLLEKRTYFVDGALTAAKYGVTLPNSGGSSPVMILGDLFSRWGWIGISLGMASLGFVLRLIDIRVFSVWSPRTIIFFVLFGRYVWNMVNNSLFNLFVDFARELPLMALISYFLARLAQPGIQISPKKMPPIGSSKIRREQTRHF